MGKTSKPTRASQAVRNIVTAAIVVTGVAGAAYVVAQGKNEPIQPVVAAKITNPAKVELGKKLFFDPRLSKSGFISCNSCHNLSMGGSDNLPTSIGDRWQQGPINSPTVLNSSLNFVQFWDGRAKDLQEQASGPIANPKEMAFTHELAVEVLNSIPQYRAEFAKVYGDKKLDINLVADAIAEFEKTLKTPNSRFDQWLKGNKKAITAEELKGYELFKSSGCTACHNGEAVGGTSYQKMGVFEPYKTANTAQGRADVTKNDAERFFFKVPTLRNVELTYPYFHDGAAKTLEEAVDIMGRLQLGRTYTPEETAQIVAFLKTLTGEQPKLQLPILPPSQNNTPRPKPFE
ncbi:MAG: cytochrome-c peroxidase [Betaproteobacteria bacterium]|nr:cytochrome-c peroxidase [Betaproteobacteria bacterium]